MEEKITTCSYIYVAEFQFKSVEMEALVRKGSVSYGLTFPSLTVLSGTRYRTAQRTISGWHKRSAGRNLVVHRHGTTLRQSVQRYPCFSWFFFFFFCLSFLAIVGKEAFHSCPVSCPHQIIVDGYCVLKPILQIKHVTLKI